MNVKRFAATLGWIACISMVPGAAQEPGTVNCSYRADPQEYELRELRAHRGAYEAALRLARSASDSPVAPSSIPRVNFIDKYIFDRLARDGVPSASLSGDEEFLRRVTLDLTGRTPSALEIRTFLRDSTSDKRSRKIDELLESSSFLDKWSMWLGDLLQNASVSSGRSQRPTGRNRMYDWIRKSLETGKSFRDIAWESVATTGNNFEPEAPGVNFSVRSYAPMGPVQDTFDLMFSRSATVWLGIGNYDCLLCHDGRGHLDTVNVWGSKRTRLEAWRMAAYFSRTRLQFYRSDNTEDPYYQSTTVVEQNTGEYALNTSSGNRPAREPRDGLRSLRPIYRDGREPTAGLTWRDSFVKQMIGDPMFARNLANRLWRAMFNLGLAEPVDLLDPTRLDPAEPPPPGWTFQASHPELLEELANWMRSTDYRLKDMLRLLANSSAYQLSSSYGGTWDITKVPTFARHIPRRLEGEEVHDILLRATGVPVPNRGYTVQGRDDRVQWAMQLPEPTEPRSNRQALDFMNSFQRGNRDTVQRNQSGSILMMLQLMNSAFVNDRLRPGVSPYLQSLTQVSDDNAVVEEMFLTFLSRRPTEAERKAAMDALKAAPSRRDAISDLGWSLVNKTDFLFSY